MGSPRSFAASFEIKMMRDISDSPFPRCDARARGSDSSLVLKAADGVLRAKAPTRCSVLDSIETKENSAVKIPALSKSTVSPLLPRKLDFENCKDDREEKETSPLKEFRRPRTTASTHQEKRFKGVSKVIPKVALELFHQKLKTSVFFRCFEEEQIVRDQRMRGDVPALHQDDDCDTDEESADIMRDSLLAALETAILQEHA